MLQQIAVNFTDYLVKKNVAKQEDREIYIYGFEALFSTLVNTILVIISGILLGILKETIIYVIGFAILRVYCGGYHAKTHIGCVTYFGVLYFSSMALIYFFPYQYSASFSVASAILSYLFILKFAPIEHKNRPFVGNEFAVFRRAARIIGFLEVCVITIIAFTQPHLAKVSLTLSVAVLSVVAVMVTALAVNKGKG